MEEQDNSHMSKDLSLTIWFLPGMWTNTRILPSFPLFVSNTILKGLEEVSTKGKHKPALGNKVD